MSHPSKEEVSQKIGQLLATTDLSAKAIIQQVLGKKTPVQAELQLVYGHPEWKARKERATKKRLEELKPPTPPEEGKEPEIEVEKLPPTIKPPEKEEAKEEGREVIKKIVKGEPLKYGKFKKVIDAGLNFIVKLRPHLTRPAPSDVEYLDEALVDLLNEQDVREWLGKHWTKINFAFATGVIAVPIIEQEWDHQRQAKKPKKEEEKKPEAPSKEASVTVPTTPTGEGSVTVTATPPPPESEKPDWYYKLKGEQPPT